MSHNRTFLSLAFFLVTLATNNNGFDVHNEIKNALVFILREYTEENSSLLISSDNPTSIHQKFGLHPAQNPELRRVILKTLMELQEWTIQISNKEVKAFNKDYPGTRLENCLIFIHEQTILDENLFAQKMRLIRMNPLWYPYGKVIVILEKTDEETSNKEWSRRVIDKIWRYTKNDDMLVMIPNISKGIEFYTWFPYHPPDCSEVKTIVYLDSYLNGKFEHGVDLYPEKVTSNLRGCDFVMVTASCIPYVIEDYEDDNYETKFCDGVEIQIIKALSEAMHFNIKFVPTPDDFWLTTTGDQVAGAFKLLTYQQVDLAFSCMMLNFERYYLAEPLPSYFDDSLIWLVPTPKLKSHIYDLFKAFPINFWFCIVFTFMLACLAVILIVHCEHRFGFYQDQRLSNISYFVKMTGMSFYTSVVFNSSSILLRSAIAVFLLYSMHITTAYQASLYGLFRTPAFEGNIESLKEAVDAGLYVYLRESTKVMYNQSDHELWNQILAPGRSEYLYDWEAAFDRIADEKSAMALYIKSTGLYIVTWWYSNDFGVPKILYLKDKFSSYPVTMYMSPGSPLFPVFRNMIYRLIASGLVDMWYKNISTRENPGKKKSSLVDRGDLGLEHFGGAFLLLFALLFLASLVFLMEMIYFKLCKMCRKKQKGKDLPLKIKIDRKILTRKRTENAIYRNNWFMTRQNDVPDKIEKFFYSEFQKKKNKGILLTETDL